MQNLDIAFDYYLEKLDEGYYEVPFVLETIDILKKKYNPDNLDINHDYSYTQLRNKDFFIENIFKKFKKYTEVVDKKILDDRELINKYFPNITNCIIKFPIINITNTSRNRHTIRDLFLFIDFYKEGNMCVDSFYFRRSTFTITELCEGYVHSHVHGMTLSDYKRSIFEEKYNPCLGSTTLHSIVSTFKFTDEDLFFDDLEYYNLQITTLFNLLDIFVSWESLEGVPFKRIGNLLNNKIQEGLVARKSSSLEKELFHAIKLSFISRGINLSSYLTVYPTIKEGKSWYSIKYDPFILSRVIYDLREHNDLLNEYFIFNRDFSQLCAKNELGKTIFYSENTEKEEIKKRVKVLEGKSIFIFKGEPVCFKVSEEKTEEDVKLYKCLSRELLILFIKDIENYINYEKKIYNT